MVCFYESWISVARLGVKKVWIPFLEVRCRMHGVQVCCRKGKWLSILQGVFRVFTGEEFSYLNKRDSGHHVNTDFHYPWRHNGTQKSTRARYAIGTATLNKWRNVGPHAHLYSFFFSSQCWNRVLWTSLVWLTLIENINCLGIQKGALSIWRSLLSGRRE